MRGRPALILLLLLAALAWSPPSAAQDCNGLGVTPIESRLISAQPAQSYRQAVSIQNPCSYDRVVHTERSGLPGNWTTLFPATFDLPASSAQTVEAVVHIPDGQGPGTWLGYLRFIADPASGPSGSGQAISAAVAIPVNVTVGGTAVEKIVWLDARVEDAPQGADVQTYVTARNEGNVRTTAHARGQVLQFQDDTILKEATGSLALDPGGQGEVPVTFEKGLAIGQYRARLQADQFDRTLPFKVVAPGTLPPDGLLHAILHEPRVQAGQPARLDAWFTNTGKQPIIAARFKAEVRDKAGILLAPLASDALAVAPGQSVNLTVYWTPPAGGTFTIKGPVLYDGFLTPESTSLLNVEGAGSLAGLAWWWWLVLALVIAAVVVAAILGKRRARQRKATAGKAPPRVSPVRPNGPGREPH